MKETEQEMQRRIAVLEDQVKLLWEVLYQLPRLEGFLDEVRSSCMRHRYGEGGRMTLFPMRFEQ